MSDAPKNYTDDLRLAHIMADSVDSQTMSRFKAQDLKIDTKPDLTPVTDADRAAEELIRGNLSRARPRDAVLGEEFGETGHGPRRWVIDPIDGTKNFVRGVPVWATLIALIDDGEPVVGVVSAPALNRRWWAAKGHGAFTGLLAGSQIRSSHLDCDRVQDPYSLRCQPQVMGACLDLLRQAARTLELEANAVTDNPLVFPEDGEVISGGNFHAEPVAFAADMTARAGPVMAIAATTGLAWALVRELKLVGRVELADPVPHDEVPDLLARLDKRPPDIVAADNAKLERYPAFRRVTDGGGNAVAGRPRHGRSAGVAAAAPFGYPGTTGGTVHPRDSSTPPASGGGTITTCWVCAGSKPAQEGKRRRAWNTNQPRSVCHADDGGMRSGPMRSLWCSTRSSSRSRRCEAKPWSRMITLASRLSARLRGSRLLEPTVDQSSSISATLPCSGRSQYS